MVRSFNAQLWLQIPKNHIERKSNTSEGGHNPQFEEKKSSADRRIWKQCRLMRARRLLPTSPPKTNQLSFATFVLR